MCSVSVPAQISMTGQCMPQHLAVITGTGERLNRRGSASMGVLFYGGGCQAAERTHSPEQCTAFHSPGGEMSSAPGMLSF